MKNDFSDILKWLKKVNTEAKPVIEKINFSEMDQWSFDKTTGDIVHNKKAFFSIVGLDVSTNYGEVTKWTQPIIKQSEIGILGIITKVVDNQLYCLMQAKIEPGNINFSQIAPTFQATKSNYLKLHSGLEPHYLNYFKDKNKTILIDQLQSEQGARFIKKRNRNIVVIVEEKIPILNNFKWISLSDIVSLMRIDNLINMDTRTVISGLLFLKNPKISFCFEPALNSFESIIQWLTKMKTKYILESNQIPLKNVEKWNKSKDNISHQENKFFEIFPIKVSIQGRENSNWTQPIIKANQSGICAFIVKKINNIHHFLIQGKIECGNFDIVEMAPTVQCLTGNYQLSFNIVPYLDHIVNADTEQIVYDSMQSEEGGRFFHEQNRNMIIIVGDNFSIKPLGSFIWMTLRQIQKFLMFNNFFNIQARSLIAAIVTRENEFS